MCTITSSPHPSHLCSVSRCLVLGSGSAACPFVTPFVRFQCLFLCLQGPPPRLVFLVPACPTHRLTCAFLILFIFLVRLSSVFRSVSLSSSYITSMVHTYCICIYTTPTLHVPELTIRFHMSRVHRDPPPCCPRGSASKLGTIAIGSILPDDFCAACTVVAPKR